MLTCLSGLLFIVHVDAYKEYLCWPSEVTRLEELFAKLSHCVEKSTCS